MRNFSDWFCFHLLLFLLKSTSSLMLSPPVEITRSPRPYTETYLQSPFLDGASTWLATNAGKKDHRGGKYEIDTVVRVLGESNAAIKLQRNGIVSLASIKPAAASSFPPCLTTSPASKLAQLLPSQTKVKVQIVGNGQAIIIRSSDGVVINTQLLEQGYAQLRNQNLASDILSTKTLEAIQENAKTSHKGIHQLCTDNFVADFEQIELTTEVRYGIDGGKQVLRRRDDDRFEQPSNPGDKVGCSDFATYEDALKYYERYYSYYGDVARLDRDGDGVPCPKLPHTSNPDRYRMKKAIK